jgi:cysteinyl-tRNA synthetase
MIELVEKLIEKEDAYVVDGNVYFDISRFKDYGKLSGKRVEELMEGARVKLAEDKRNPADFALWKKAAPQHLMQWNSPWGRGFPGWHLECSVMSMKYLGDSIDIHGGGLDNQFPHHECEIAQSESASGKPFAKYWLHNNMVTVDGKKMSKSLGNHIILTELFDKYDPMTVRFFVLQGHYRSPQDFSDQALNSAQKGFERLRRAVGASREFLGKDAEKGNQIVGEKWLSHRKRFFEFMEDDFNTSGAISVLFDMVRDITRSNQNSVTRGPDRENDLSSANKLFSLLGENILGLQFEEEKSGELEGDLIDLLIHMRQEFRDKKEYAMADEIRERLNQLGIVFEDGREETKWRKVERE